LWADGMNREQAMTLLKELVANDLVDSSYVSLFQVKPKDFQIQIKCDYNKKQIETFAKEHGLTITEDRERKYLIVFKP
jgi:hypothetical protein